MARNAPSAQTWSGGEKMKAASMFLLSRMARSWHADMVEYGCAPGTPSIRRIDTGISFSSRLKAGARVSRSRSSEHVKIWPITRTSISPCSG